MAAMPAAMAAAHTAGHQERRAGAAARPGLTVAIDGDGWTRV